MTDVPPVRSLPPGLAPGWIGAVAIPPSLPDPTHPTWAELAEREQAHARAASPRRGREFVAGRVALRRALAAAGAGLDERSRPCLPGEQGRPEVPPGWTGSITHKAGWAFAVAGPRGDGTLGIDCEVIESRERLSIAPRVLRPEELDRWRERGGTWPDLLQAFSVKEAIYKALHPWVPRYIDFHEAEIAEDGSIRMHLARGEGGFALRAAVERDGDRILTVVRAGPG